MSEASPETVETVETVDAVEAVEPTGPEYTPMQMYRVAAVYDFLARLLPVEGRDYSVRIKFDGEGSGTSMNVSMEPHTPFGKVWCSYCMDAMRKSSCGGSCGTNRQEAVK